MRGCRPLEIDEVRRVLSAFEGPTAVRDRALFLLMLSTGARVSEALRLRVSDVEEGGEIAGRIYFRRAWTKGKRAGYGVPLHPEARAAIRDLVAELRGAGRTRRSYLFRSRRRGNRPIGRKTAWQCFRRAYEAAGVSGRVGTHSCRKTYGTRLLAALNSDLTAVQRAMRHADPKSTIAYLDPGRDRIEAAILSQEWS